MANRRSLSKSISMSKKLNYGLRRVLDNGLVEFAQLLYTWLIPHTDDWGRLEADPFTMKMVVMPASERTVEEFEAALAALDKVEALQLYATDDGEKCLQISHWEEFQAGLHKRTDSKFPTAPERSRKFPEVPGSSGKVREEGGSAANPPECPGSPSPEDEVELEDEDLYIPPKPPQPTPGLRRGTPAWSVEGVKGVRDNRVESDELRAVNGSASRKASQNRKPVRDACAADWSESDIRCVMGALRKKWRPLIRKCKATEIGDPEKKAARGRYYRMIQCQPARVLATVLDVKRGKEQPATPIRAMEMLFWRLNEGVSPNDDHYHEAKTMLMKAREGRS